LAAFDNNLADDTTHQLTILDHDERIVGLIQFSEEDEPHYRHASLKYLSTQQSIDEGTQPKQFN